MIPAEIVEILVGCIKRFLWTGGREENRDHLVERKVCALQKFRGPGYWESYIKELISIGYMVMALFM